MFGIINHNEALNFSKTELGSFVSIRSCGTTDFGDKKEVDRTDGWDNYMLAIVESGSLEITIENKTFTYSKNDVALIPPNIPYFFRINYGTTYHWMHFFGDKMVEFLGLKDYFYHIEDPSEVLFHLKKLPFDVIDQHPSRKNMCSLCGMTILCALKKAITPLDKELQSSPVAILSHSFRTAGTIKSYAKTAGMTESQFSKQVKEETGLSPKQYILKRRINEAKICIKTKNEPLKQIAESVGFDDYQYFTRIFKKQVGLKPSQYKKLNKKN